MKKVRSSAVGKPGGAKANASGKARAKAPVKARVNAPARTGAKVRVKTPAPTGAPAEPQHAGPSDSARRAATKTSKKTATPNKTSASKTSGNSDHKRAARRTAILDAALDEFSARGFEATRLDDVARRAGIAKGTIYLYFRDKETLFQELVRALLVPMIGGIEAMAAVEMPAYELAKRFVDLFVNEIYGTRRQDIVRLMIAEGRRFPKLAEFYYREVLARIMEAMRAALKRAATHGGVPEALIEFPQLIAAPGLIAIVWGGLFERFAPLDVRKMLTAHVELLFAPERAARP